MTFEICHIVIRAEPTLCPRFSFPSFEKDRYNMVSEVQLKKKKKKKKSNISKMTYRLVQIGDADKN